MRVDSDLAEHAREGRKRKVVQSLLDNYVSTGSRFGVVKLVNLRPNAFDIDDHIPRMNVRWNDSINSADDHRHHHQPQLQRHNDNANDDGLPSERRRWAR
jgi:hypothetical protein